MRAADPRQKKPSGRTAFPRLRPVGVSSDCPDLDRRLKVRGDRVLTLPAHISYEDAASFILTNMTAWRMVVTQGRVRAGE